MAKMHYLVLVVVMVMAVAQAASAQEGAECPSNDLTACMPAAKSDIEPTAECCTNLAAYTETATPSECLCQGALSSPLTGDDDANVLYAVLIPQKCNLVYPQHRLQGLCDSLRTMTSKFVYVTLRDSAPVYIISRIIL